MPNRFSLVTVLALLAYVWGCQPAHAAYIDVATGCGAFHYGPDHNHTYTTVDFGRSDNADWELKFRNPPTDTSLHIDSAGHLYPEGPASGDFYAFGDTWYSLSATGTADTETSWWMMRFKYWNLDTLQWDNLYSSSYSDTACSTCLQGWVIYRE